MPAKPSRGGSDGQLDCKQKVDHGDMNMEVVSMSVVLDKKGICMLEFFTVFLAKTTPKMRYLISSLMCQVLLHFYFLPKF